MSPHRALAHLSPPPYFLWPSALLHQQRLEPDEHLPHEDDVEELLVEGGLKVSYETVRRWVLKFGPVIACNLRRLHHKPSSRYHLDEMVVRIAGKRMYLWRAVDDEGDVLDMLVQRRRDKTAARKLMRKLLKKQGFAPMQVTTDKQS